MKIKADHKLEMEAQLKAWKSRIDLFDAGTAPVANFVDGSGGGEFMQPLNVSRHEATATGSELKMDSAKSWGDVRESADKIWDGLKSEFSGTSLKSK